MSAKLQTQFQVHDLPIHSGVSAVFRPVPYLPSLCGFEKCLILCSSLIISPSAVETNRFCVRHIVS
jgi:hypothetical protein